MTKQIQIGTVSHGTLRSEDLIDSFSWALRHLAVLPTTDTGNTKLLREADSWLELRNHRESQDDQFEELGSELVNDLIDALNDLAPDGHYFGAHEGDGSDFGFWPIEDLDEAPTYNAADY